VKSCKSIVAVRKRRGSEENGKISLQNREGSIPTEQVDGKPVTMNAPCRQNPFLLVSWWDMEKFAAEKFVTICSNISIIAAGQMKDSPMLLEAEHRKVLADSLRKIERSCREIGLKTTALQILSVADRLDNGYWLADSHQISQTLLCLNDAIRAEMSTHLFLRVFPNRAEYFEQEDLFSAIASAKFPSAKRDIKDAGTCYACDRNTAAVMHLMRVLELGLNTLARELKVPFDKRNWENIINDIECAIKKVNGPSFGSDWKTKLEFYSGAAKDFRYFKDAWRNHAMHFHEHYDDSDALTVLNHVGGFMKCLAVGGLAE
jgi:hypothetical protein